VLREFLKLPVRHTGGGEAREFFTNPLVLASGSYSLCPTILDVKYWHACTHAARSCYEPD